MEGSKTIVAYFAALIVLAIIAYFLYTSNSAKKTITTTTTLTTATTSTQAQNGNTSTTIQTTTSMFFSSCLSKNATETIPNGDFSLGTYAYWNESGPGFRDAPLNITWANNNEFYYGSPWNNYTGTFFATTYGGVAVQAGNLTSNPFPVRELYLDFKIISQQNSLLYIEILNSTGKPKIIDHYNTYSIGTEGPTTFVNASIPIGTLLCQNASIRIVAGVIGKTTQGTNYIAAGDFVQSSIPYPNSIQPSNQTIIP